MIGIIGIGLQLDLKFEKNYDSITIKIKKYRQQNVNVYGSINLL